MSVERSVIDVQLNKINLSFYHIIQTEIGKPNVSNQAIFDFTLNQYLIRYLKDNVPISARSRQRELV